MIEAMGSIPMSGSMAKKKKKQNLVSAEEVAAIVELEGLGYAVMHYLDFEQIADYELRAFWEDARVALKNIDTYLQKKVPDYGPE